MSSYTTDSDKNDSSDTAQVEFCFKLFEMQNFYTRKCIWFVSGPPAGFAGHNARVHRFNVSELDNEVFMRCM